MTNFEKITNMSVEELADKLNELFDCYHCPLNDFCTKNNLDSCSGTWEQWLKSEVEE